MGEALKSLIQELDQNNQPKKKTAIGSLIENIAQESPKIPETVFTGNTGAYDSKYDNYLNIGNIAPDQLQEMRGRNQTGLNQIGSGLVNAASEVAIGTIKNASYLFDLPQYLDIMKGTEEEYSNFIADALNKTQEALKLPVYRTRKSQGFAPQTAGWWGDNMPSLVSTLSMVIPASLATQGLGNAAKLMGGNKILKALGWGNLEGNALKGITGAVLSRHMESIAEAGQTFQSTYDEALSELQHKYPNLDQQTLDAEAKKVAGQAAADNYKYNWGALATDIPEYMILFGAFGKASKLGSLMKSESKGLRDIAKTTAFEGIEEGYQFSTDKEATRKAMILAGLKPNDNTTLFDRSLDYAKDGDFWTSVSLGGIGGGVSQAVVGRQIRNQEKKKQEYYNNLLKAQEDISVGNPEEFYKTQDNVFLSKAVFHAQAGTLDLFRKDLENLAKSDKELLDNPIFDDKSFKSKVQERLQDLDYLENTIAQVNNTNASGELKSFEINARLSQRLLERRIKSTNESIYSDIADMSIQGMMTLKQALLKKDIMEFNALAKLNDTQFLPRIKELGSTINKGMQEILEDQDLYPEINTQENLELSLASSNDAKIASKYDALVKDRQDIVNIKKGLEALKSEKGQQEISSLIDEKKKQDEIKAKEAEALKKEADINKFVENVKKGIRQASPEQIQFYENNKEEIEKRLKESKNKDFKPITQRVQKVEITGVPKTGTPEEHEVIGRRQLENGFFEYLTKDKDGNDVILSQKDGYNEINTFNSDSKLEYLYGPEHFTKLHEYNRFREEETLTRVLNKAKSDPNITNVDGHNFSASITKELIMKNFPGAFPALESKEIVNKVLALPNYNDYIKLKAQRVNLTKAQENDIIVPLTKKDNLRGTRKQGIHISLVVIDPNNPKKETALFHSFNPDFYEEKIDGEWRPVDFSQMSFDRFKELFSFKYLPDFTETDFINFVNNWKNLKEFTRKAEQFIAKYPNKELPKSSYTIIPTGSFDFTDKNESVSLSKIPELASSDIVFSLNTMKTITGKELDTNAPEQPDVDYSTEKNSYFALAKLKNGIQKWIRVFPKSFEVDSEEGAIAIEKINEAYKRVKELDKNKSRAEYKTEIKDILGNINTWIKPINSRLSTVFVVTKNTKTGEFALAIKLTYDISEGRNNPSKYYYLNKEFTDLKSFMGYVNSFSVQAGNKVEQIGKSTLRKNLPIDLTQEQKDNVLDYFETNVKPGIINDWSPRFVFMPDAFEFKEPSPVQKEAITKTEDTLETKPEKSKESDIEALKKAGWTNEEIKDIQKSKEETDNIDEDESELLKVGDLSEDLFDFTEGQEFVSKNLPDGITLDDIDNLKSNIKVNGTRLGTVQDKAIYIHKNADKSVLYHEAFHVVYNSLIEQSKQKIYIDRLRAKLNWSPEKIMKEMNALKETSSIYANMNSTQLENRLFEELLADDYADFQSRRNNASDGVFRGLFRRILAFIQYAFSKKNSLTRLYTDISTGAFKNSVIKNSKGEYLKAIPGLSSNTSIKVRNTIAGKVLFNLVRKQNPSLDDIEDAYYSYLEDYNPLNPVNVEYFKGDTIEAKDRRRRWIATGEALKNNKVLILTEVQDFIEKQGFSPELVALDEFDEKEGEQAYDKPVYEFDPSDGIGSQVKLYLSSTLYEGTDPFGRKVLMALPWREVYNRMLPLLSRSTTRPEDLMSTMEKISGYSSQVSAIFNRLKNDTGWSESTPEGSTESKNLINMFQQAFNVERMRYSQVVYDKGTVNTYVLNEKDLGGKKYERWNNNYLNNLNTSLSSRQGIEKSVKELDSLIVQIENQKFNIETAKQALGGIGIDLTPDYLKLCFPNSEKVQKDKEFFEAKGVYFIQKEDIAYFRNALRKNQNIYSSFEEGSSESKLKLIADSDALFDQSLFLKTFPTADGKIRYSFAQPSLIGTKLRDIQNIDTKEKLEAFINTNPEYYSLNPLLNKDPELVLKYIANLKVSLSGDLRDEELGKGVTMKNTDVYGYLMTLHGYFASQNASFENKEVLTAPFTMTQVSDKSTQFNINLPVQQYYNSNRYSPEADNDLWNAFKQELNRLQGRDKYSKEYVADKDTWITFRIFNTAFYGADKALEMAKQDVEGSKQAVLNVIKRAIKEEVQEHINLLREVSLVGKLNQKLIEDQGGLDSYIHNFTLNQILGTLGVNQLISGDYAWTKNWEDYVKRASLTIATGTDYGAGNHTVTYINDVNVYYNRHSDEELTEEEYKKYNKLDKEDFDKITVNDAQVYSTLESYLDDLRRQGTINKKLEDTIQRLIDPVNPETNKVEYPSDEEIAEAGIDLIPSKQVTRGNIDQTDIQVGHKMAVCYLSKRLTAWYDESTSTWKPIKGRENLFNRMQTMENQGITHMIPKSAAKLYFPKEMALNADSYNEEVKQVPVFQVPNIYRRLQLLNYSKNKAKVTHSNQIVNINGSEVTSDKGKELLTKLHEKTALMRKQAFDFTYKLLIKDLPEDKKERADISLVLEVWRDMVEDSSPDSQKLEFLELDEKGTDFKYDSNVPHLRGSFSTLFLSTFKNVFRQKVTGVKYTAMSGDGLKLIVDEETKEIVPLSKYLSNPKRYADNTKYSTRDLMGQTYKDSIDKDGNLVKEVVPAEVLVPKKLAALFNLKIGDALTPEMIKLICYRVPSQSYHSIQVAKIVDFLPEEYGDTIIAPKQFVWAMGMDYDVDAVYAYRKAAYINSKGKTVIYGTETTPEEKFEAFVNDLKDNNTFFKQKLKGLKLNNPEYLRLNPTAYAEDTMNEEDELYFKKILLSPSFKGEEDTRIREEITKEALEYFNFPSTPEEYAKSDLVPKNTIWNEMFDIQYEILSLPELSKAFKEPLSEDKVNVLTENANKYSTPKSPFMGNSPLNILNAYQDASQGKGLTGVAVTGNSFVQFAQENDLSLNPEYNINIDGKSYYKFNTDSDESRDKFDFSSGILSVIVDNQKNPRARLLNLDFNTVTKLSILAGLGVNPETIGLFLLHPFVRKVSKMESQRKSIYKLSTKKDIEALITKNISNLNEGIDEHPNQNITKEELQTALEIYDKPKKERSSDEKEQLLDINKRVALLYYKLDKIDQIRGHVNKVMSTNRNIGSDKTDYAKIITAIHALMLDEHPVFLNQEAIIANHPLFRTNAQVVIKANDSLGLYDIGNTKIMEEVVKKVTLMFPKAKAKEVERVAVTALLMKALNVIYEGKVHEWSDLILPTDESIANKLQEAFVKYPYNLFLRNVIPIFNKELQYKVYHGATSDSMTKLTESNHDALIDAFMELRKMKDTRELAGDLYKYLIIKDNLLFRNNSFVKFVSPELYLKLSEVSKQINNKLANDVFPQSLINQSEEEFTAEFIENFVRHKINLELTRTVDGLPELPSSMQFLRLEDGRFFKNDVTQWTPISYYGDSYRMPYAISPKENEAFEERLTDASREYKNKQTSLKSQKKVVPSQAMKNEEYTNYSGGALGGDKYWEEIGKKFGIGRQVNYTPSTLDSLNKEQLQEVETAYQNAVKALGRGVLAKDTYSGGLVRRDYLQAKAANQILAISTIIEPGAKDKKGYTNKTSKQVVEGGTGYAVEMGIQMNKQVYVFDQLKNKWFIWKDNKFVETETPVLDKKYAGIGTRELNENGKRAIEAVYNKTFNKSSNPLQITLELKDGKTYSSDDINIEMLEKMNYSIDEIGQILKKICK